MFQLLIFGAKIVYENCAGKNFDEIDSRISAGSKKGDGFACEIAAVEVFQIF